MITSSQNPRVQWVKQLQARSKARRESGAFVVEGVRLVEEALQTGWGTMMLLHTSDLEPRGRAVLDGYIRRGVPVEEVTPQVLKAVSDTETPQGLLAVLEMRALPTPPDPELVLIPDGVRDPGNLGSMLRSAAAAGADLVCLPAGTVDAYAPKVVRSAMGAHFRLPLLSTNWDDIQNLLERCGLAVFLAVAGQGILYTQADFRSPLAMIIGGEAAGAGDRARSLPHQALHIPMPGGMESLNAAAAAAILLFEVVRQRSQK
jgi:TrmH family RNA methyltransferase